MATILQHSEPERASPTSWFFLTGTVVVGWVSLYRVPASLIVAVTVEGIYLKTRIRLISSLYTVKDRLRSSRCPHEEKTRTSNVSSMWLDMRKMSCGLIQTLDLSNLSIFLGELVSLQRWWGWSVKIRQSPGSKVEKRSFQEGLAQAFTGSRKEAMQCKGDENAFPGEEGPWEAAQWAWELSMRWASETKIEFIYRMLPRCGLFTGSNLLIKGRCSRSWNSPKQERKPKPADWHGMVMPCQHLTNQHLVFSLRLVGLEASLPSVQFKIP